MDFKLPKPKTIIEPFRIKMVEKLPYLDQKTCSAKIKAANYNLFSLNAADVRFDLLTDSGTSAMSATQWSAMMIADESYAGSDSFLKFSNTIKSLTGLKNVIPTHQGRSAEQLLMHSLGLNSDKMVLGNTHFDTTRANIELVGAKAIDLPCVECGDNTSEFRFKGNVSLDALEDILKKHSADVELFIMTVTNNSVGGLPVSMENIRNSRELLNKYNIPLFLDCARFAENSYFIKQYERGYEDKSVKEIAREMFSYADGALMSSKKDAFANIGGFLALNDHALTTKVQTAMVVTEGFPTYGGLAGRDLEAVAVGLEEVLDENYLNYRISSVNYFGKGIEQAGYKVIKPIGGHAVYIDAGATLPHIPAEQFPGQSLSVALYEAAGIRSVEVGSVMLGHFDKEQNKEILAPKELVRLAMPRRVYTQSHVDYMIECMSNLSPYLDKLGGYKFTYQAPALRHFTAKFAQI